MWNASRCAVRCRCRAACASSVIEPLDGRRVARRSQAGQAQPAEAARGRRGRRSTPPSLRAASSWAERSASLTAASDHVLQHLDVLGVDRVGVDRDRLDARGRR